MSRKNSNDTIRNRTRDVPVCSVVPQSPAPPRAPLQYKLLLQIGRTTSFIRQFQSLGMLHILCHRGHRFPVWNLTPYSSFYRAAVENMRILHAPYSTILNINIPTDTEPPRLACTLNRPATVTIPTLVGFQQLVVWELLYFWPSLGCHMICILMMTVQNICFISTSIQKSTYKSRFLTVFCDYILDITRHVQVFSTLITKHWKKKRSTRTHITYTSSVIHMFYYM